MEKEKTLYEKAIEKEMEVNAILQIIQDGESPMWQMTGSGKYQLDVIFGKAFPYVDRAIRRSLRYKVLAAAKGIALDELKKVRQLAAEEARKILKDCDDDEKIKEVPEENEEPKEEKVYHILRCKMCGAFMPNRKYGNVWECTKCRMHYYDFNDVSYKVFTGR